MFNYVGEINGCVRSQSKVIRTFKGHNRGEIGFQRLFAYAASYKPSELIKYVPSYVTLADVGSVTPLNKQKIKISGLRYEEDKGDDNESKNPRACLDFTIVYDNLQASGGSISLKDKEVHLMSIDGIELATFLTNNLTIEEQSDDTTDPLLLQPGLQINVTWKMSLRTSSEGGNE